MMLLHWIGKQVNFTPNWKAISLQDYTITAEWTVANEMKCFAQELNTASLRIETMIS